MNRENIASKCACSQPSRREVLQTAAAAAAVYAGRDKLVFAEPGQAFEHLIPVEKNLSAEWLRSLFDRGKPEWFTQEQLEFIGMPVGGICCGQIYLGGDGRLWLWDVFRSQYQSNYQFMSRGVHYMTPPTRNDAQHYEAVNVEQGFAIRYQDADGNVQVRSLDRHGFDQVSFRGEYPVGRVTYQQDNCPIHATLEAFSPFIPLQSENSSTPATVVKVTLRNQSDKSIEVDLAGWLANHVFPDVHDEGIGNRINRIHLHDGAVSAHMTAEQVRRPRNEEREDIVFADFEDNNYTDWIIEGDAFGSRPFRKNELKPHNPITGNVGDGLINSHNTNHADVKNLTGGPLSQAADRFTGKLISKSFKIERNYITFRIGGGGHAGRTCMNLIVDGENVRSASGANNNHMRPEGFSVQQWSGKEAKLEIVDVVEGGWGNVSVDHIVFTDTPPKTGRLLDEFGDGSMALSIRKQSDAVWWAHASTSEPFDVTKLFERLRGAPNESEKNEQKIDLKHHPLTALGTRTRLAPGQSKTIEFLVSWWFPYYQRPVGEFKAITDIDKFGRQYLLRFDDALHVAEDTLGRWGELVEPTLLWRNVWNDSTLPHWFLDRTFVTINTLATQTCHWLENGRFYGWEGVTCCPGTCQHVWNYAQGLARVFPELERDTRERVDYGIAYRENGALDYRAESARHVAIDGQLGTIIRAYREHLTSPDHAYLKRLWPKIRKSIDFMILQDGMAGAENGLLEGAQYNTLDQAWYGPMGWISSMYLAALRAGQMMAQEMGDVSAAKRYKKIIDAGMKNIVNDLYDGEYFIHKPDPNHADATNTNIGCHIDQVFGQSLCWQVGLDRVIPKKQTVSALHALWKYNFTRDAGGYRGKMQQVVRGGRVYADESESGLVMCSWPKGGAEKARGGGNVFEVAVGYFNECMTGFEYQVASHMIYEGDPGSDLVEKGMAITKAIHERYAPNKRNPYNEIECSDHYSRAMASFGVYLAACGFEYHGPKGWMGFAPKIRPENFKAAFIAAEGWGTYEQTIDENAMRCRLVVRFGRLRLTRFTAVLAGPLKRKQVKSVTIDNQVTESVEMRNDRVVISLDEAVIVPENEVLEFKIEI